MIELRNIKKIYRTKDVSYTALDGVSLVIDDGEFVAITGKSGSGKSTLLHLIAGIDDVTEGDVIINGKDIVNISDIKLAAFRKNNIGIILQDFGLIEDFSVIENISIPLVGNRLSKKIKKEMCNEILLQLGIMHLINKQVNKLSDGEKQKVAIARALIAKPNIILADEPTGALDNNNSNLILDIISNINSSGKTVILVTHDKEIASRCNRIIELNDGKIINDSSYK
ncbi:MAG: ABC transporter ATP-binding protein [Candidatus Methanomethylophilus sp.]|nr:ABC transporter ATP-binding protein [Methanomethylophilus sp.]